MAKYMAEEIFCKTLLMTGVMVQFTMCDLFSGLSLIGVRNKTMVIRIAHIKMIFCATFGKSCSYYKGFHGQNVMSFDSKAIYDIFDSENVEIRVPLEMLL